MWCTVNNPVAELPKFSDKYRPSLASQPTLKRKDLHEPFFPKEVFEEYFNPKRKRPSALFYITLRFWGREADLSQKVDRKSQKKRLNLDELVEDADDQEKSDAERSDVGSQPAESDYDVDEEYDNDYAENYFDNGEGDDMDDLGGGGGDEGGGGKSLCTKHSWRLLVTHLFQDTTTTRPGLYYPVSNTRRLRQVRAGRNYAPKEYEAEPRTQHVHKVFFHNSLCLMV